MPSPWHHSCMTWEARWFAATVSSSSSPHTVHKWTCLNMHTSTVPTDMRGAMHRLMQGTAFMAHKNRLYCQHTKV